ncbi:MAG: ATP-binding protein [Clostridia bacterium]|nr:ATP-binding protein [Clostridia bacterium]
MAPSYINNKNPKYLEVDGKYYAGILVVDYYREYSEILFKNLINTNVNMNISIFYEKQDTYKTIKDLTYFIGNVGVDLKSGNANREDIDIAAYTYNDAKFIRKEMQVNNEELYFLYTYITIISNTEKELERNLNKIEGILQASGMMTRNSNFRQEQTYKSCLPLMENNIDIKQVSRRNILTNGLIATYPFISSNICDENGVFIGTNIYNNSIILVDRFNKEKYKNANMCVFGTSGAGKSFYIKLLILRYRIFGLEQYIIDPEREYNKIAESLEGVRIKFGPSSNYFINVLDIREDSIEEEKGFLTTKISKLRGFFGLVFGELDEENVAILEEKLIEVYKEKGINFDDNSLYKLNKNGEKIFKESVDMPILEDLYKVLEKDGKTKYFKTKLYPFIYGSLSFLNNYTNVELENKLIVADIYDLGEENLKYGMYIFVELFWDKIKKDRNKNKAIYLDEIWRLIGVTSNQFVASFIYKIFKTIRKYGGSAVAITQDVSDLFSLDNGAYGKSILNNSSIKSFFALEEENILVLEKYANISEKEKIEIKSLKRGETLMFIGDNHVLAKIECSEEEKELIS